MPNLNFGELFLIFALALLVFGWKRLPQLGEGMGKAIRNFKRGLNSDDDIEVTRNAPVDAAESARQLEARTSSKAKIDEAEIVDRKV